MLSIGTYPTICQAEDEPDSQMRSISDDELFESFTGQNWEKFSFDNLDRDHRRKRQSWHIEKPVTARCNFCTDDE